MTALTTHTRGITALQIPTEQNNLTDLTRSRHPVCWRNRCPGGADVDGVGPIPPPLSLLSEILLRFLGSAMGIAIANRKNRCDFGALRAATTTQQKENNKKQRRYYNFSKSYNRYNGKG